MSTIQNSKVLVVDNDPLIRLGTIAMLEEMGCQPQSAINALSALSILGEFGADLLITDYSMPGMTGVELARSVTVEYPATRILIITGHHRLEEELGHDWSLLGKPFTIGELRGALDVLLAA